MSAGELTRRPRSTIKFPQVGGTIGRNEYPLAGAKHYYDVNDGKPTVLSDIPRVPGDYRSIELPHFCTEEFSTYQLLCTDKTYVCVLVFLKPSERILRHTCMHIMAAAQYPGIHNHTR